MGGLLLSLAPLTNAALALLLVFGVVTTGDSVFFRVIFACYQMMFVLLIYDNADEEVTLVEKK